MPWAVVGGLLNSALYLSGCVLAGLVTQHGVAWRLGLAALGVTYLGYLAQIAELPRDRALAVSWLSNALGVAAGIALLF